MSKAVSCTIIGGGLIATAGALALEDIGAEVTVVTRAPRPQAGDSIEWTYGDVNSQAALTAVRGAKSVIYAGGTLGPATQLDSVHGAISDEIVPVLKLAEEAARTGAKTFIFISSGGTVYGPDVPLPTHEGVRTSPINMYGTIKVLTELALLEVGRKYGISIVILRVSNPYGPGQTGTRRMGFIAAVAKSAMAEEPIVIWGDGSTMRDFIFIDDVGRALALAANYSGDSVVLNIGSGEGHSLLQICDIVSENVGRPLDIRFESGRSFDVPKTYLDISRAAAVLGWHPQVKIEEGIALLMKRPMPAYAQPLPPERGYQN